VRLVGKGLRRARLRAGAGLVTLRDEPDGRTRLKISMRPRAAANSRPSASACSERDHVSHRAGFLGAGVAYRTAARQGWRRMAGAEVAAAVSEEVTHEARRLGLSSDGKRSRKPSPAVGAR